MNSPRLAYLQCQRRARYKTYYRRTIVGFAPQVLEQYLSSTGDFATVNSLDHTMEWLALRNALSRPDEERDQTISHSTAAGDEMSWEGSYRVCTSIGQRTRHLAQ